MNTAKRRLAACAATALAFGIAHANPDSLTSIANGFYRVSVWSGNGTTTYAALPTPSGAPDVTFTYNGPIDFTNNSGADTANTFGDFGFTPASITDFSSPYGNTADFLAATMSTPGFRFNSYLDFTGSYTAAPGTSLTVSHDDGASLYIDGSSSPSISSPSPTTDIPSYGLLPPGTHNFSLVYVESNGAPADLTTSVPEPSTLALLGTGLVGLALVIRRRRKS